MQNAEKVQNIADTIRDKLPLGFTPKCGLVLGTGLGRAIGPIDDAQYVSYSLLPDFPESTADSHAGRFVFGKIDSIPVVVQDGRCHLYEGRTAAEVAIGVQVMGNLGISSLVLTNAAGSINPLFTAGSLMVIDDHINRTGQSPLTGKNEEEFGLRFPDMSRVYDPLFIKAAEDAALKLSIPLYKGVYLCTHGPELETRAETRAYRGMGADAVGMSTVMEAIAAHHLNIRTLGISCLTNQNLPDAMEEATIEGIIAKANACSTYFAILIRVLLPLLVESE